jgi:large subunit ribosomal protein L29
MDATELRGKTPDQLREELSNLKKEAFNLRFQQAIDGKHSPMRVVKRSAARKIPQRNGGCGVCRTKVR